MADTKQTPRQKMIGMMYLVLTALLALNVSKEILNAFAIINAGLERTNVNFASKNDVTMNDKAEAATKDAKDMFDYIANLKVEIFMRTEEIEKSVADTLHIIYMNKKDNYDIPTHYMIGSDPGNVTGEAKNFKQRVNDFRKKMLAYIDEKDRKLMNIGLTTEDEFSVSDDAVVS